MTKHKFMEAPGTIKSAATKGLLNRKMFAPLPVDISGGIIEDSESSEREHSESLKRHFSNCEELYRVREQYGLNLEEICSSMSKGMEENMLSFMEANFYKKFEDMTKKPLKSDLKKHMIKMITESPVIKITENSCAIQLAESYFTNRENIQYADLPQYQGSEKTDQIIKALLDKKAKLAVKKVLLQQSSKAN
uniref:RGS domain-containing protein n=1 Tax=Rhabditophanes sp. KR3021 TaxID=114890 RepID=A0AC35UCM1_9BILA